jgi:hypothetical protein
MKMLFLFIHLFSYFLVKKNSPNIIQAQASILIKPAAASAALPAACVIFGVRSPPALYHERRATGA